MAPPASAGHDVGRAELRQGVTAKTALIFNNEHPAQMALQTRPRYYPGNEITWSNTYLPLQWFAGGKVFPELKQISWNAFKEFGQSVQMDESPASPASDLTSLQGAMNTVRPNWRVQDHIACWMRASISTTSTPTGKRLSRFRGPDFRLRPAPSPRSLEEVDKLPIEKLRK